MSQHTTGPAKPAMSTGRKIAYGIAGTFAGLVLIGACNGTTGTAGTAGAGSSFAASLPTNSAESDVVVTECGGSDALGLADVTVRITNSTDRVQSYFVTVSMNDATGARLAEANGASNSVAPGQSASADLLAGSVDGVANCTVANVSRFAN